MVRICEGIHHQCIMVLQVRQFSFNQSLPCAFSPPLVHALYTLPEVLLVDAVYLILAIVEKTALAPGDFQRRLVLAPVRADTGEHDMSDMQRDAQDSLQKL